MSKCVGLFLHGVHSSVPGLDFQRAALKTSYIVLLFTASEAGERLGHILHAVDYSYQLGVMGKRERGRGKKKKLRRCSDERG